MQARNSPVRPYKYWRRWKKSDTLLRKEALVWEGGSRFSSYNWKEDRDTGKELTRQTQDGREEGARLAMSLIRRITAWRRYPA